LPNQPASVIQLPRVWLPLGNQYCVIATKKLG